MLFFLCLLLQAIAPVFAATTSALSSTITAAPVLAASAEAKSRSTPCTVTSTARFEELSASSGVPAGYMAAYWDGFTVNKPLARSFQKCNGKNYLAFKPASGSHVAYGQPLGGTGLSAYYVGYGTGGIALQSFSFACSSAYIDPDVPLEMAYPCKLLVLTGEDNMEYAQMTGESVTNLGTYEFVPNVTCAGPTTMTQVVLNDDFRLHYYFYMVEGYGTFAIDNVVFEVESPDYACV